MSTNLIQKFEIGQALARIFQIKERTPSPTFGSEVVPVVIVDDLLPGGYPPRRRVIAGTTVGPGAPNISFRVHTLNCRGSNTEPERARFDKVVCHKIQLISGYPQLTQWALHVGTSSGITGLTSLFAQLNDTTVDQPAVGSRLSDFTSYSFGESVDVFPTVDILFHVPQNIVFEIPGPFIIGQGECIALRTGPSAVASTVLFYAEEWPAA